MRPGGCSSDKLRLEALIASEPGSDLIPKIVRGLLGHRRAGRWGNTQENAFVLLALERYFAAYEKETPDFVARAWLGEAFAGEHLFRGRTTERRHLSVPMNYLAARPVAPNLILSKDGPGRLSTASGCSTRRRVYGSSRRTTVLWEGVHTYSYVARATTPGAFVVPPTKAEEMDHPETFGRGATDRVVVE